jgi:hypothetical protein
MEVAYKTEFDSQRERFSFCFTCEHCSNFDEQKEKCVNGFPNSMHRLRHYQASPRPHAILFCKEFDLV